MSRILIDVREPEEFAQLHASGAINIPLGEIMKNGLGESVSKDSEVVLYCNSGNRSGMAERVLKTQGYKNVVNGINQQTVEQINR